uniref:nucleosome assembly protein 1-like 1-A n=1 Tax=Halichoerus grypus TaxID=9711 RepID=UPI001658D629|nr:nucleosome assembly protein 1-like 1-A [Halichoerus grypus]
MDKEEEETDTPEGRVLDAITDFKLGYFFCHLLVPKSTSFFTKEATEYQYEKSDEEAQEAGGEEKEVKEDENEEPEERQNGYGLSRGQL